MTYIYNTTNLRESLIRIIIQVVIPPRAPEVTSIKIRNKREGGFYGNWGYFYPQTYRITINTPQNIDNYPAQGEYTKHSIILKDRYEFLATVIGHEYRHAWQWMNERHRYTDKNWIEVDAENWELDSLQKWREYVEENKTEIPLHESKDQKVVKTVRWRDFR